MFGGSNVAVPFIFSVFVVDPKQDALFLSHHTFWTSYSLM